MINLIKTIRDDFRMVFERDPAARSRLEIILCYPGLHALVLHRVAHGLWKHHLKLLARVLSQFSRWITGIEIHPAATIGRRFFIDHGMGIVIGETTVIGEDVTLYQGVTLGGVSWSKGKRHPTLEDKVVVGAGAIILGPIKIGHDSRIGSCSVVIHDVPTHSTVVGIPGRVVHRRDPIIHHGQVHEYDLAHNTLPDPFGEAMDGMRRSIVELERRLEFLEKKS
ncbi:MAG: serine O-acetyltransferase [bacterium]